MFHALPHLLVVVVARLRRTNVEVAAVMELRRTIDFVVLDRTNVAVVVAMVLDGIVMDVAMALDRMNVVVVVVAMVLDRMNVVVAVVAMVLDRMNVVVVDLVLDRTNVVVLDRMNDVEIDAPAIDEMIPTDDDDRYVDPHKHDDDDDEVIVVASGSRHFAQYRRVCV